LPIPSLSEEEGKSYTVQLRNKRKKVAHGWVNNIKAQRSKIKGLNTKKPSKRDLYARKYRKYSEDKQPV